MSNPTPVLSLYDLSTKAVMNCYNCFKNDPDFRILPENILFDVYYMFYKENRLCHLGVEFSDLDVFARMLRVTNKRLQLLKSFQTLMDHGTQVAMELSNSYCIRASKQEMIPQQKITVIDLGISLGGFLSEAGWFFESERVLSMCWSVCEKLQSCSQNCYTWRKSLECCHKLLHAQAAYSMIESADLTRYQAAGLVEELLAAGETMNLAGLYTEFSLHSFFKSNYDEAFKCSMQAINELTEQCSPRVIVETLSQASKACIVKREFVKARVLVTQAVYLARDVYGPSHPKFADTLLDYGFYLLNSDCVKQSVAVYEEALALKKVLYGQYNLHVAVAQEDLAYALYVHEYSSGMFRLARENAEEAIKLMKQLLPAEHLMLASAQRVKALILEEIALDNIPGTKLLSEAEKLHKDALRLAKLSFGEENVQTAKHYGNLGRLYQSMRRFKDSEQMHLKAIAIKEKLVGPDDYEVGLSVGHLASLYNYHMQEYRKAEQLYFRSIKINLQLYSDTYSGLEYDYRGLIHVYDKLGDADGVAEYTVMLTRWKELRERLALKESCPLSLDECPKPLSYIKQLIA
ncbi:amyloid protein-binding protein 2 isoform X5 [Homalodisca vitripennis]|nr:amyloid protein-binding protein 2 isoform X5 [Homalodisca vitripennis]